MSTSLYYEPAVERETYLGKDLKYVIAPIVWDHDGSLGGQPELVNRETTFYKDGESINLYQFLRGFSRAKDDAAKEAAKLVELIDEHDGVWISLKG